MGDVYQDPYADFARRYDRFYDTWERSDPAYLAFFRALFSESRVQSVLDCACGTGRDLYFFYSMGCTVCGSDISEAMLAQAEKNLSARGITVSLTRADFRELPRHFNAPFDAVVCLSTSLPHLLEEPQIVRALLSMREVLRDDGILILSQGMCDKQMKERPRFIPEINSRDFSRVFVMEYYGETMRINVLDLIHGEDERDFEVSSFDYRVLLRDDYERLLAQTGYGEVNFYGSYRFDPYDRERSDRLIVIARA